MGTMVCLALDLQLSVLVMVLVHFYCACIKLHISNPHGILLLY